jgi:hypothetical protein
MMAADRKAPPANTRLPDPNDPNMPCVCPRTDNALPFELFRLQRDVRKEDEATLASSEVMSA